MTTEPTQGPTQLKRPPGRPKGTPKTGGRTKGSPAPSVTKSDAPPPDLTPRELRCWLADKSGYYDFMAKMCSGRPIRQRGPTGKQTDNWYYPSVADMKWAATEIGRKCLPDLSATQLTGEDGDKPIEVEVLDDRELARQVALILSHITQMTL